MRLFAATTLERNEAYQRAHDEFPGDSYCWYKAGRYYEVRGQLEKAAECFERVVELDSAFHETTLHIRVEDAYTQLGRIYARLGDPDRMIQTLHQGIRKNPNYHGWYYPLGELYAEQRRFGVAVEVFEEIANTHSKNRKVMLQIARALVTFSRPDIDSQNARWAHDIAEDILDQSPDDIHALTLAGLAEFRLGRFDQASKRLEEIVGDQEWHVGDAALARSIQALCAAASGNDELAEEHLREAELRLGSQAFWPNFEIEDWSDLKSGSSDDVSLSLRSQACSPGNSRSGSRRIEGGSRYYPSDCRKRYDGGGFVKRLHDHASWNKWMDLALEYYQRQDWQGAEREVELAIKLADNKSGPLLATAPLLLLAGKTDEYRALCERLLDKQVSRARR